MLIRSVHLTNVKSYDNLRVDFTPGVNAITGHNGAGKSTLVEAIGYALFDVLDYTKDLFVRAGCASGLVGVVFSSRLDGRDYLVERPVGSGAYRVSDCESNALLVSSAENVHAFIRRHLGLSETADLEKIFHDAVGVPQGTLTAVFLLAPAPRKLVFDPLLQVEDYRLAYQNLAATNAYLTGLGQQTDMAIAKLQGVVAGLPAARTRVAEIERDLAEKSHMLVVRQEALKAATLENDGHEARRQAAQRTEQTLRLAQMNHTTASSALAIAQSGLAQAREAAHMVQTNLPGHTRYVAAQSAQILLATRQRGRQAIVGNRMQTAQQHAVSLADVAHSEEQLAAVLDAAQRAELLRPAAEQQLALKERHDAAIAQAALLRGAETTLNNRRRELDTRRARLAKAEAEVQRSALLVGQDEGLRAEIAAVNGRLEALNEAERVAMAHGMAAREHQEKLEAVGEPTCPVCKRVILPQLRDELLEHDRLQREEHGHKLRSARAARQEAESQKNTLVQQRDQIGQQLRSLASMTQVEQIKLELAESEGQVADELRLVEQLSGAQATVDQLKAELQQLGEPAAERTALLAQASQQATVELRLTKSRADSARLAQELGEFDTQLLAYAHLDAEVDANAAELATTQAAFQTVLAHRGMADTLPQREVDLGNATATLEAAQGSLSEAEVAHAQAGAAYSAQAHQLAQEAVHAHTSAVGGLKADVATLHSARQQTAQEVARLEAEERKLRKAEAEREQIERQRKALEKMRNVIKEAGPRITNLRIQRISAQAAEIFRELSGDYASRLKWEEDYSIVLDVDGRPRSFKQLSGGEQMVAALAVRLALLREMSAIKIAIFDEPTANLDPQRRERLAAQIAAIKGFEQVLVISHDDTFEASTVNVIRLEKQQGATRQLTA